LTSITLSSVREDTHPDANVPSTCHHQLDRCHFPHEPTLSQSESDSADTAINAQIQSISTRPKFINTYLAPSINESSLLVMTWYRLSTTIVTPHLLQ
jgi:hypothetical protein